MWLLPRDISLRGQKESQPSLEMIVRHHVGLLESSRYLTCEASPHLLQLAFAFQCMSCIRWTGSSPVEWRNLRRCVGTVPDLCILIHVGRALMLPLTGLCSETFNWTKWGSGKVVDCCLCFLLPQESLNKGAVR